MQSYNKRETRWRYQKIFFFFFFFSPFFFSVFEVDLDANPSDRWNSIVNQTLYFDNLWWIYNTMNAVLDKYFVSALDFALEQVLNFFDEPYQSEIRGIARVTGLPNGYMSKKKIFFLFFHFFFFHFFFFIAFINLIYEITNACTSIAVQSSDGKVYIVRNQDLGVGMGFTDLLRNQTVHLKFLKNGTVYYEGVSFAGYVGKLYLFNFFLILIYFIFFIFIFIFIF